MRTFVNSHNFLRGLRYTTANFHIKMTNYLYLLVGIISFIFPSFFILLQNLFYVRVVLRQTMDVKEVRRMKFSLKNSRINIKKETTLAQKK